MKAPRVASQINLTEGHSLPHNRALPKTDVVDSSSTFSFLCFFLFSLWKLWKSGLGNDRPIASPLTPASLTASPQLPGSKLSRGITLLHRR